MATRSSAALEPARGSEGARTVLHIFASPRPSGRVSLPPHTPSLFAWIPHTATKLDLTCSRRAPSGRALARRPCAPPHGGVHESPSNKIGLKLKHKKNSTEKKPNPYVLDGLIGAGPGSVKERTVNVLVDTERVTRRWSAFKSARGSAASHPINSLSQNYAPGIAFATVKPSFPKHDHDSRRHPVRRVEEVVGVREGSRRA